MIPVEPSADLREIATALRGFHVALVAAGFTEEQAFELVRAQLVAVVSKPKEA